MKTYRYLLCSLIAAAPAIASAADLTGMASYYGPVTAVAPGFYGHVGVEMADGTTCRGRRQLILLTSNPHYTDILSLLLTAQASHANVKFYAPASQQDTAGFCTIGEAAIGNFTPWP